MKYKSTKSAFIISFLVICVVFGCYSIITSLGKDSNQPAAVEQSFIDRIGQDVNCALRNTWGEANTPCPSSTLYPTSVYKAVTTPPQCLFSSAKSFSDLIVNVVVGCFFSPIIRLIFITALFVFVWGIFRYVIAEEEEKKESGREFMIWGLVGFFVMLSLWGIINILAHTFGTTGGGL